MLRQAFQNLPAQVQPFVIGIGTLQAHQHPQRVGVMVETAVPGHGIRQGILARMAEGRVTDIMREAERLGQILVKAKGPGDYAADLRHLETMGQAGTVMIPIRRDEDLCLPAQPAESDGMDDAVAVTLKFAARSPRTAASGWKFAAT